MPTQELDLSSLPAKTREGVQKAAAVAHATIMKGLLNRLDPAAFPSNGGVSSRVAKVIEEAHKNKPRGFAKMRPLIERQRPRAAEFSRIVDSRPRLNLGELKLGGDEGTLPTPSAGTSPIAAHNRLQLVMRALHCVDETDAEGGSDEMIVGGVLVGASGATNIANTIICTGLDDGERINFGPLHQNFGIYSLNSTPGYPKFFGLVLKLVESDGDDEDVAAGMELLMSIAANVAEEECKNLLPSIKSPFVTLITAATLALIYGGQGFAPHVYGLRMMGANEFGGAESGNLRTKNMKGDGGTYRIGYKWRLLP